MSKIHSTVLIFMLIASASTGELYAQGQGGNNSQAPNTHWKTNGNNPNSNSYLGTNNFSPLILKTDGQERLRVMETGKIGIGTIPTADFDINSTTRFRKDIKIDTLDKGNPNDKILTIDGLGKVRSIERSGLLEGIYEYQGCIPKEDNNGNVLYNAPVWTATGNSQAGILYTGQTCPAFVGIGLDNPDVPLHVIGNAKITGELKVGLNSVYIGGNSQAGGNTIYATGDLEIQSDVSNDFNTIINANNTGFVGIGVTNPAHKLEVGGTIRACKLIAEASTWCDYVFDEDYSLMPIDSLAKFIKTHRHLPEIPSVQDVQSNGVDVVDMETRLLKKVEELTLYIIQLNEKNDALQREIEAIKISQDVKAK